MTSSFSILSIIAVACGGALGAVMRHLLAGTIGTNGILLCNIIGCFALGFLLSFLALKTSLPAHVTLFLTVGILGGFTTFSAFSLETVALFDTHRYGQAATYILLSVGGGITAFILGRIMARGIFS